MTKSIRMAWYGVGVGVRADVIAAVPPAAATASSRLRTMFTATSPSSASSHEQPALTRDFTSILRVIALSSTTSTCMLARIDQTVLDDGRASLGSANGTTAAVQVAAVGVVASVRQVLIRSERRVGKECLRLCRSRWSPYH